MRYFSTFTGIGGFEVGIRNAYRSTIGRVEEDKAGDEGQGLLTAPGKDISATEGQSSERIADIIDQRPLRSDVSTTPRHKQGGVHAETEFTDPKQESMAVQQPTCVGYSEIDKYADQVFKYHFKGVKNYGDITKINAEELPDFDCLVGGFPCQAFSVAGKRRGFEDTRGTLFFDLARILKAKQPRLFVFENVKGLLSHDNGRTFKTIIAAIDELGYDCQWQVLNSKNHGVPQNRERIIIVGHLRGTSRPQVFPIGSTDGEDTRVVGQDVAYTIDANYHKGTNTLAKSRRSVVGTLRTYKDGNGLREMKSGVSPTIPARARADGSGQPVMSDGVRVRRLTPLECERLQGFPDYWTEVGCNENLACSTCIEQFGTDDDDFVAHSCGGTNMLSMSDTQRYKMCGNAVTTNVIQAVFERIFENEQ